MFQTDALFAAPLGSTSLIAIQWVLNPSYMPSRRLIFFVKEVLFSIIQSQPLPSVPTESKTFLAEELALSRPHVHGDFGW